MGKGWTKERRAAAAERCRANKPWEKSTGPKTRAGKMRSSMNALKHGQCAKHLEHYNEMLRLNRAFMLHYYAFHMQDMRRMDLAKELIKKQG